VRLCMFHPADHPLERGWVGRIDGDVVTHLAAQTLQSFFTGGGAAREHAAYLLAEARFLAPVLHPPSIRVFDDQDTFAFANPAAIHGPGTEVRARRGALALLPRLAAVIGAQGEIGGLTLLAEWRRPGLEPPKDRDFALGLGPVVVTPDELDAGELDAVIRADGDERLRGRFGVFDWKAALDVAADGTRLFPGDLLAASTLAQVEVSSGSAVELEVPEIGTLTQTVSAG
jgi:Fumarylacetoacetate (FAA) hydrolase family